ncbi:PucR family transcriptional regulator [Kineothrix sp. MB12-C1]|uniref:PucR family transcriptional regulator n=1 Tax=Kineothrix sp. MB12-C1 TaxID=3070215 RepID=UPI0027D30AF1|nr:helix-turn-helix domain-containing protein [Kineothrix sp. MB12-C1]WMC91590.1 helix-turn-helix domain-containing protein [Kineothrix sp. MB12-C1]
MISNQILQNTIEGLKAITRVELCVMDVDGKEIASTTAGMESCSAPSVEFASSPADSQEIQGYQYFKIFDEQQLEYILIAGGAGEDVYMVGKMVAFQIQGLLIAYKERFDKDNFIKNLLLDNLLLVDIYSRAKKLHIQADGKRVVMIIETENGKDSNVLELMRTYFGNNSKDFITAVDENNVIVVKDLSEGDSSKEIDKTARHAESYLVKEGMNNIRISYGTTVNEIKEVSRSYKEAKMALDVGKIFFNERDIIAYSELGIGRLIYQLPIPLCKMFIKEIFGGKSPDDFDEETLTTINKFFENSLNVSETSRQLFIHRNTLVYRLDKLQKSTGLDLRVFEDAITFKIALMVVKYMKYMETFEY